MTLATDSLKLEFGRAVLRPDITPDGELRSLGEIRVDGTPLRNPVNRFLPWFDSYDGGVFNRFRMVEIQQDTDRCVLHCRAISDSDYPFRERRDSSGDICLRPEVWDREPVEADFRIVLEPAEATYDGLSFHGFRYWYEYASDEVPIHRILDRQTWEIGGNLDDVTLLFRCLFDLPMKRVTRATHYSSVGLEKSAQALPGNLWARWSLLQPFDLQCGSGGVVAAFFDQVSNIRSVIESSPGEDWIRVIDLHQFENTTRAATNPKTVLFSPEQLDEVAAINLWTRLFDEDHTKASRQFGIQNDPPPRPGLHHEEWQNFHFDTTFDDAIDLAAELGAEQVCIGAVWESSRSFTKNLHRLTSEADRAGTELDKRSAQSTRHKLHVLDYEVAEAYGGEPALKNLCTRARAKGVGLLTGAKFCLGVTSYLTDRKDLGEGLAGIYNAKESGRHPDSGYPFHTCSVNLHAPIGEHLFQKIECVMNRTGLAGFLWDSTSNMGWWQINYSDGTLRPPCQQMAEFYARLSNAGYYLQPEGILSFSNHTAIGLHGGNIFEGKLGAFAYNSAIPELINEPGQGFRHGSIEVLMGRQPFSKLFAFYAHKRVSPLPSTEILSHRDQIDSEAWAKLKRLIALYKRVRDHMQRRTIMPGFKAVMWEAAGSDRKLYWVLEPHRVEGPATDAETDDAVDGELQPERVYWL